MHWLIALTACIGVTCAYSHHPIQKRSPPEDLKVSCPECYLEQMVVNFRPRIFPPKGLNDTAMNLQSKITLRQIVEFHTKEERLKCVLWLQLTWWDHETSWEPEEFNNITEIRVRPRSVWVPDLLIENSLDESDTYQRDTTLPIVVGYSGIRIWTLPIITNTKCKANVLNFPFDSQVCKILITSWTYHHKMVNFSIGRPERDIVECCNTKEWDITSTDGYLVRAPPLVNHPLYPDQNILYKSIQYHVSMVRRPYFYIVRLFIPSISLVWIGSMAFLLPSDCEEKLSFATTLYLTLCFDQMVTAQYLPPTANSFPFISRFYLAINIVLAISIVLTSATLMLHFRIGHITPEEDSLVTRVFHKIEDFGIFSLVVRFSTYRPLEGLFEAVLSFCKKREENRDNNSVMLTNKCTESPLVQAAHKNEAPDEDTFVDMADESAEAQVEDICSRVAVLARYVEIELMLKRWRLFACGLDRIVFCAHFLLLSSLTCYFTAVVIHPHILPQPAHVQDPLTMG